MSEDEFFEFCTRYDLGIERTTGVEVLSRAPFFGGLAGNRTARLTSRLGAWSEQNGEGLVFASATLFRLPNKLTRSPSLAWVRRERWERLSEEDRRHYPPLCPDFVIELLAPTDSLSEAQTRMDEYLGCGAQMGWLIDPDRWKVEIYRPGRQVETLDRPTQLSGEDVLPGLTLELHGIM